MENKQNSTFQQEIINNNNKPFYNACQSINPDRQQRSAMDIFCNNIINMLDEGKKNNDKYWHSMANCQSAQNGYLGGALGLSLVKELYDYGTKTVGRKGTQKAIKQDCRNDLKADFNGIKYGLWYPTIDCSKMMRGYWKD